MESITLLERNLELTAHVSGCYKTKTFANGGTISHRRFCGSKARVSARQSLFLTSVTLTLLVGAGKTYLTSKVIDHVQGLLKSLSPDAGFAYFYCNRNEEERRDPLSILQSCVRQLSTAVGSTGHIRKSLQVVSDKARRQGSHLGLEACKTQLLESVNGYSQTSIIIDALDECYEHSRWQLIDVIRELVSKSDRPLKVFISSRPDEYIKTQFSGKSIEIHAINNQDDIEKFVNAEIDKPRHWGPISQSLRSDIVRTVREGSQGM